MNITVYLPFVASILVGLAGPVVARRARPAVGATALAAIVAIGAIGTLWATALLAATSIDDVPFLARSVGPIPVPDPIALVAFVAFVVASVRLVAVLRRRRRLYARIHDAIADLEPVDSDVVVIADARPDAFAVPARGPVRRQRRDGRIVLTEGMLAALDNGQRTALLAHERAHLRARHDRLRAAADLAAAANPLLIPARNTVGFLCERWADERAVAEVGSRRLVANAIATAALAQAADTRAAAGRQVALGFNHSGTVDRVAALHRPPASALRTVTALALVAGVCILAADVNATGELLEIVRRLV
jgi:beta-lactamase regulating signal transducer with metallopeptidase domain